MSDEHLSPESEKSVEVSKSRIKKEMLELKTLGKRLLSLKQDSLERLPLSDSLRAALKEATKIKSHNAQKRHLGFIGKLMRDQDIASIQDFLDRQDSHHEAHTRFFHQVERWRDQLVGEKAAESLTLFVKQYPCTDIQHLKQLVRTSQKEIREEKPPAGSRKLFRYLKEVLEENMANEASEGNNPEKI